MSAQSESAARTAAIGKSTAARRKMNRPRFTNAHPLNESGMLSSWNMARNTAAQHTAAASANSTRAVIDPFMRLPVFLIVDLQRVCLVPPIILPFFAYGLFLDSFINNFEFSSGQCRKLVGPKAGAVQLRDLITKG